MNRKIAMAVSLILALIFTVVIVATARKDYSTATETVTVAKAAQYIPLGTELTEANIEKVGILKSASTGMASFEEALGKTVSVSLIEGQHIYKDALSTSTLPKPGCVEVLVSVDLAKSAFAMPGEKVNVHLIPQELKAEGGLGAPLILEGIMVLRTLNSDGMDIVKGGSGLLDVAADNKPAVVGLEIPKEQAENVVYGAANGALYLTRVSKN